MNSVLSKLANRISSPFLRSALMVLGIVALAGCTSTNSGVTTVYYSVPGVTAEQINAQIARRGPQNGHAIGTTETRMTPKIKTRRQDGQCYIESVDVLLDIRVTLPRWSELEKADGNTQSKYRGLASHVEWHEQQHVDISRRYAKLIENSLLQLPPVENCRLLMNKSRVLFKNLFDAHNQEQRAFDAAERKEIESRLTSLGYS